MSSRNLKSSANFVRLSFANSLNSKAAADSGSGHSFGLANVLGNGGVFNGCDGRSLILAFGPIFAGLCLGVILLGAFATPYHCLGVPH